MHVSVDDVARVCHEANRALCAAFDDHSQMRWEDAPDTIKASAIDGVSHLLTHPDATPDEAHANWRHFKALDGWTYGPAKDATAKTHPCLVPYATLPAEQKAKDYIFAAIVRALLLRS